MGCFKNMAVCFEKEKKKEKKEKKKKLEKQNQWMRLCS